MKRIAFLLLVLLFLPSCASARAHGIERVTYERDVEGCERLAIETTHSTLGFVLLQVGKYRALQKAEQRAKMGGATHALTIENRGNAWTGGYAVVVGYKCPR